MELKRVIIINVIQLILFVIGAAAVKYNIYQVIAFNEIDRGILYRLLEQEPCICFLNGITNEAYITMEVAVHPFCEEVFESNLGGAEIEYVNVSQVNVDLENEKEELMINNVTITFLHKYNITQNMFDIIGKTKFKKYPHTVTRIKIGESHEGRDLSVFRLGPKQDNNTNAVFILGGETGRDWISPVVLLKALTNLVYKNQPGFVGMWDYYDFYFVPMLNPDGYVFSKNHDRFWERNRKNKSLCNYARENQLGVNIDRNWYFVEEEEAPDLSYCMKERCGLKPLSEPETRSLSQYLNTIAPKILVFINLKGFGKMITIPYGYPEKESDNYPISYEILLAGQNALQVKYNATYDIGLMSKMFYLFFGGCADWVKEKLDVPIVYTLFMSGYDYSAPANSRRLNTEDLSNQLITFLEEILYYTKIIYGSLANNQDNTASSYLIYVMLIALLIL